MQLPLITHPHYSFSFADKHRFPMQKFRLLHALLVEQGIATNSNLYRPAKASMQLLKHAHCADYLTKFIENKLAKSELRRMGLPWSEALVRRTLLSPVGTLLTCQLALKNGIACHLAGGTHHAHFDFGSGFCILNDLAIAANSLLAQGKIKKILIFDLDVHQGDGTARILHRQDNAFTCSVHCEKNFPARKAESNLDINIPSGATTEEYLEMMMEGFEQAIRLSQPELIIYDAGVDIFSGDPLGLINVSVDGIRRRDHFVLNRAAELGIPIATVIGGGYDKDERALASRHAIVVEEAYKVHRQF